MTLLIFSRIFFIVYIYENIDLNKYYNDDKINYGLGRLVNDMMLLFTVILPLLISGITALFAVKSRNINLSENPKGLKKYKRISMVGYVFMLISCLLYTFILVSFTREVIIKVLAVSFYTWVIAVAIIGLINTKKL